MKRVVLVAVGLLLTVAVVAWWYFTDRPSDILDRLLAGDEQVEIATVRFTGHERQVVLDDPASVAYLTRAFRTATYNGYVPQHFGRTYSAELRFVSGGSFQVGCYVPTEVAGLTICPNWHTLVLDDPFFYWAPFSDPMPEPVRVMLRKLWDGD